MTTDAPCDRSHQDSTAFGHQPHSVSHEGTIATLERVSCGAVETFAPGIGV